MEELQREIISTVLVIATPVLVTLLTAILVRVMKRLGLDLSAEREARLEKVVRDAVLRAEEWGATRVKANATTTAAMKLQRAIQDVTARIPGITQEEAAAIVHATLPKVGAGATAFLEGVRQASTTGAQ